MSQSSRKSSIGIARRAAQRAHIPYRADDLGHGKKTGISVNYVDHKSDDFEPFDEVLVQADEVTPPHLKNRRRVKRTASPVAEYDEGGEVSMELDDTNPDSPHAYFHNTPRPSAPTSANRTGTSSRFVGHASGVDFDRVPSPRPSMSSAARKLQVNNSNTPANRSKPKSRLSQSFRVGEPEEDHLDDMGDNKDDDSNILGGDDHELPPMHSSPTRRTSFSQIDQDDDDDDDDEQQYEHEPLTTPRQKDKGKGRQEQPPEEEGEGEEEEEESNEDEIARSLEDAGLDDEEDEEKEEDERVPEPAMKKSKAEEGPRKATARKTATRQQKAKPVEVELSETDDNVDGLRRGTRKRYQPLEWWRLEKVIYGRRESGTSLVPVIKDIVRLPKEKPQPLGALGKRKRRSAPRSKSGPVEVEGMFNPEEGWDDTTDPSGVVLDYVSNVEVQRRVAFTAKMVTPKATANGDFLFQKIFGDGDFIAAGQLIIPPDGKKPSKGTKDNTYVFYVMEGAINLKVHRTSFILATGGMFLVPRGNTYYIENISKRPAKLFFAQARKIPASEEEVLAERQNTPALPTTGRKSADTQRRLSGTGTPRSLATSAGRSSSAAAPPRAPKGPMNGEVQTSTAKKRAVSK